MTQKKKVQVRFQTTCKTIQSINHDFRIAKPNYLRDDMYHNKFDNIYFGYDPKQLKHEANKSFDEYNLLYKKKHHRNLQKGKQSDHLTGVITLSPIVNEWIIQGNVTKEQLEKSFIDAVPLIQDKIHSILGDTSVKLSHYVIHYDEKTPHMHFAFNNHTKNGDAVWHNLKNSGRLSEFQDIVASTFKNVGFKRGDKKSKAKHLSVRRMHEEEIKDLKKEVQQQIKELQEEKKKLKKTMEDKIQLKSELDNIDKSIRSAREQLKNDTLEKETLLKEKKLLEDAINTIKEDKPKISIEKTRIFKTDDIMKECISKNLLTTKIDEKRLMAYLDYFVRELEKHNKVANTLHGLNHPQDLLIENQKLLEENNILHTQQQNIDTHYVKKQIYNNVLEQNKKLQTQLAHLQQLNNKLTIKVQQSQAYYGMNQKLKNEINILKSQIEDIDILGQEKYRLEQAFTKISKYLNCDNNLHEIVSYIARITGNNGKKATFVRRNK